MYQKLTFLYRNPYDSMESIEDLLYFTVVTYTSLSMSVSIAMILLLPFPIRHSWKHHHNKDIFAYSCRCRQHEVPFWKNIKRLPNRKNHPNWRCVNTYFSY